MCASPVLDGYQPLAQCVAHPSSNLFSLQGSGTKLLWQWMNSKPRYFNLNYTYTDAIVNDEDHFKLRGWGGDQSHYNPMFGGFWSLWMNWFFSQKVSEKLELQSGSGVSGAVRFSRNARALHFPFFWTIHRLYPNRFWVKPMVSLESVHWSSASTMVVL